jgi:hypothetical protein
MGFADSMSVFINGKLKESMFLFTDKSTDFTGKYITIDYSHLTGETNIIKVQAIC